MTAKEMVLSQLARGTWLYEKAVGDFGDGDAKFQPCEGGNHLNWILLHMAATEDWIAGTLSGKPPVLSEDLHERYRGGSECVADDGMTKAEAWKTFTETRARTVAFVQSFDESTYGDALPEGTSKVFSTVSDLIGALGMHQFWNVGQVFVNRRMLKKEPIFSLTS